MKKKSGKATWKFWRALLAAALCLMLCLTGCGGGGGGSAAGNQAAEKAQADPLEGKYIPVVGEMMGVALAGDDLSGFGFELQPKGKAVMTVDGESHNVKWKSDESTITITVDGEDITGERGEDFFVVKDMLGMGMDLTFAKEGTPAADPAQYLPESEKFLLQDWQSVSVTDILGDPTDAIAPDAVKLSFRGDHTVDVSLEGEDRGSYTWGNVGDWGKLGDEGAPDVSWNIAEDGLSVDYVKDGTYYTFFCPKDPAAYKAKAEAENEKETEAGEDTETEEAGAADETAEEAEATDETAEEAADGNIENAAEGSAAEENTEDSNTGDETEGLKSGLISLDNASGAASAKAVSAQSALAEIGEHGKAASSPYADYWDRDWYGWYQFESCDGDYENLEGMWYDACASIFVDGTDSGKLVMWDEDGSAELGVCEVEVSFGPGTTGAGCMKSESGSFLSEEENVGHADWLVDPGASDVSEYDHMIEIDGKYEDENGSLRYYIFLRPWGMDWEDVREEEEEFLPASYDSWYLKVKDSPMPDRIGNSDSGQSNGAEANDAGGSAADSETRTADGGTVRIESYFVMDTPEYYPAGKLTDSACYVLPDNSGETDGYILDADTVLEKPEMLDGWEEGDDPLSWMERLCDEGSTYTPAGVYDITVTGRHIDVIHGLYWWD